MHYIMALTEILFSDQTSVRGIDSYPSNNLKNKDTSLSIYIRST